MANVKSDAILPFDPALRDDLHFDLLFKSVVLWFKSRLIISYLWRAKRKDHVVGHLHFGIGRPSSARVWAL
jgi:hypothetical protein